MSAAALALGLGAGGAPAQVSVPVFAKEVPAGGGATAALAPAFDPKRSVDGRTADWRGEPARFGGAVVHSSGELVYQDHIFDAYGPDNGQDVQRRQVQQPLLQQAPDLYRVDPALQYLPGEFGVPTPGYELATHYGDLDHQDEADLSEVRVGTDDRRDLWLLARTTTLRPDSRTALLVLLDTKPGPSAARDVPFSSGIRSGRADHALLLWGDRGWSADLSTGAVQALPAGSVATDAGGYNNAIEARVSPSAIGGVLPSTPAVAVATGVLGAPGEPKLKDLGLGANLANVAFRAKEPSRNWWDEHQAFALHARTIDPFFQAVDTGRLLAGANERYVPGPGYHDRLFVSTDAISEEKGEEGVLQHYGLYLPKKYRPGRASPLQWWFHFRGGSAHIAAAAVPRIFKEMGEDHDTIVATPRGRGPSTWYVGRGHIDYLEVREDIQKNFSVDDDRNYIAGHSMGGWASFLLPILYPDRFAASFPASAPSTQGAWTGVDFAGCDEIAADGTTPCYTEANGSDPRAQFLRPLLENLRHVPLAIYHGAADELVPVTGVARQVERLQELGYRYRFYLFPAQEHYGPPVQDQWTEGARYEHSFKRDPNPARVSYVRSMPFERATERVSAGKAKLSFDFDRAYWMSGLQAADATNGVAHFEGRSLALQNPSYALTPEAGVPTADQTGPYTMAGQAWRFEDRGPSALSNAFEATLTGASAVTVDSGRMGLAPYDAITGNLQADRALRLTLAGPFGRGTGATLDGRPIRVDADGRRASVDVPAGKHVLVLEGAARRCVSRRSFIIRLPRARKGDRLVRARVQVNGRTVRTLRGKRLRAPVDLRGLPKGIVRVKVVARTTKGRTVRQTRRYRTCVPKR